MKIPWKSIGKVIVGVIAVLIIPPIIVGTVVSMDILNNWTNSNDWIGFWGGYLGSVMGAGVAAWGIIKTIRENRKLAVEPYLIFEEVNSCPEDTIAYGHFLSCQGNKYATSIIKIQNIG